MRCCRGRRVVTLDLHRFTGLLSVRLLRTSHIVAVQLPPIVVKITTPVTVMVTPQARVIPIDTALIGNRCRGLQLRQYQRRAGACLSAFRPLSDFLRGADLPRFHRVIT